MSDRVTGLLRVLPVAAGVLLLAAAVSCGSNAGDSSADGNGTAPIDPFGAAQLDLSQRTGVPVDEIVFVSNESRQWPNACLGLPRDDEACAEVITPGFRIVLEAAGKQYAYRTDQSTHVRLEE